MDESVYRDEVCAGEQIRMRVYACRGNRTLGATARI